MVRGNVECAKRSARKHRELEEVVVNLTTINADKIYVVDRVMSAGPTRLAAVYVARVSTVSVCLCPSPLLRKRRKLADW